ncbi:hypothetical protein K469DRAFT_360453 [Zopfia rhizophila CBS 207.26]|uniref:polynucleotide adenylyltransferase n=1 Tax=Zopfia rhizophila CBS 207.26 TaxID=1314779 RepID=A0A6A6EGW5_9PEZI|nr:hypothetical protein K469DRAFT_360453 [Zopfia rhizophila CBS 207.26]
MANAYDSYRPGRADGDSDRKRDPPRSLESRMVFSAGRDSYRPTQPQRSSHRRGGQHRDEAEFTFESGHQAPQFPPSNPAGAQVTNGRRKRAAQNKAAKRNSDRASDQTGSHYSHAARHGGRRGFDKYPDGSQRPFRKPAVPHERPLLQPRPETSPEHLLGVVDGSNKFLKLEDLSEGEAEMEIDGDIAPAKGSNGLDLTANDNEASHKKTRVQDQARADGNSVPKWSNPDPYTVLPPPTEPQGKKRDFVQLIRKAKIAQSGEKATSSNAVAANDDFISFGDDVKLNSFGSSIPPPPDSPPPSPPNDYPITGSLNEVAGAGALPTAPHRMTRSAGAASIGENLQQSGLRNHKRKRGEFEGGLVEEWMPRANTDTTPWCRGKDYTYVEEMSKWLHNEILDFFDYIQPNEKEKSVRRDLIQRVEKALRSLPPGNPGQIHCFGSFPAGLYLPTADMDLVYASSSHYNGGPAIYDCSTPKSAGDVLWSAFRLLRRKRILEGSDKPEIITRAKVPIVKFVDKLTGLKVDLSFEMLGGVQAQETFVHWKEQYPDMPYLVLLIKQFLVMRGLNDVHTGGLGGFSIICLTVSFIQTHPQDNNLGTFFLDFLDYYGNKFNLATDRIIMHPPYIVKKGTIGVDGRSEKVNGLSITDPNNSTNNISGGSSKAHLIFKAFSDAHRAIQQHMNVLSSRRVAGASVLEPIIGGNYDSYHHQRARLLTI